MLQINVDISILMCLPTDSTFICTADRRVAIITAYHSSCAGISDIIKLLVHHCVTGRSLVHSLNRLAMVLRVRSIKNCSGRKRVRRLVCV